MFRNKGNDWVTPLLEKTVNWVSQWPAFVNILIAAMLTPAFFWFHLEKKSTFALVFLVLAIIFIYLGVIALYKEWKMAETITAFLHGKRNYTHQGMIQLIAAIFHYQGFKVRKAPQELIRHEVDLVATRKKETSLIQMNHWNEENLAKGHVEALHKSVIATGASSGVLITFAQYSREMGDFARTKEVVVLGVTALQTMAAQITGFKQFS